jgi:hypothetical protein
MTSKIALLTGCALVSATLSTSAAAADDTDKGIIAGLGIAAAAGKTTLGAGAGTIEASIINQEALQQAGAIVAMVTNGVAPKAGTRGSVLLMTRGDTLDFTLPEIIKRNMNDVTERLKNVCPTKPSTKPNQGQKSTPTFAGADGAATTDTAATSTSDKPPFWGKLQAADLAGFALTDSEIGGMALTVDDRSLLSAVLMNAAQPTGSFSNALNRWNVWTNPFRDTSGGPVPAADIADYQVLGEPADINTASGAWQAYETLTIEANVARKKSCIESEAGDRKGWLEIADGLLLGARATEKGVAPIALAAQIDRVRGAGTLIVRVAVDSAGGTTINRSGFIYALGWPNAGTVSSGIVVSFRVIDPAEGKVKRLGVIRCFVRQTNIRRMAGVLEHKPHRNSMTQKYPYGDTVCDYKVAGVG